MICWFLCLFASLRSCNYISYWGFVDLLLRKWSCPVLLSCNFCWEQLEQLVLIHLYRYRSWPIELYWNFSLYLSFLNNTVHLDIWISWTWFWYHLKILKFCWAVYIQMLNLNSVKYSVWYLGSLKQWTLLTSDIEQYDPYLIAIVVDCWKGYNSL